MCRNSLIRWTSHKDILWLTDFDKIKVIYCTGNGFIELYKGEFNALTTCTDHETYKQYKHLWTAPIKYLKGYEDGYLIVQLWNTKKLNKIYGVKNRRK